MNSILHLKGRFESRKNDRSSFSVSTLPKGKKVSSLHLYRLQEQLSIIYKYWKKDSRIGGALVSVYYNRIVPKSSRLKKLLSDGSKKPTDSICGVKFEQNEAGNPCKHIFTHYISLKVIDASITYLGQVAEIIEHQYAGEITSEDTESISKNGMSQLVNMKKTPFLDIVFDAMNVERFGIEQITGDIRRESIVTIYKTNIETKKLLLQFGIDISDNQILDQTTLHLFPDEIRKLQIAAPYLIAMNVTDFTEIAKETFQRRDHKKKPLIPAPAQEPIIGVIDTHFNSKVYFQEWVEYHNMLDSNIELSDEDYYHGTEVSAIIVDGPRGNPRLDDGCGRFRVRHFGVARQRGFSSFEILRMIRFIVASNTDIQVWNLSLGSKEEIRENFISPVAAELDRIQNEYDVIFVVAGTNKASQEKTKKIGSPADSLNSLVVNAVNFQNKPASYTRIGPVLSFFYKPDLSYYGGDGTSFTEKIATCRDDLGVFYVSGTSFAAPWIARKLAYLIHIMGMSREVAKALLIDAAAGWANNDDVYQIGYGVVPTRIEDIINTPDDEIRFILTGATKEYETYNYNLPIPVIEGHHPFFARATLVYFPVCDRQQGVDYTSTEMDMKFGRLYMKDGKPAIKDIQKNRQGEEGGNIFEKEARNIYRKWDNVKHISEIITSHPRPRKAYEQGIWGISIKTKERVEKRTKDESLPFGVVVTLKEMNGNNRYDEFVKLCMMRGWIVNKFEIENQLKYYIKAQEELHLE